jgi:uncharacterized protein YcnI
MHIRSTILVAAGTALLAAAPAAAHVTLNPNTVPADSFSRFAIRVPTERPDAATVRVTVQLPEGLFFVSFQPKPGWNRTVTMEKLDPPVEVFGEPVSERVASVTWAGGEIAPGEFDEFGMSAKVPDEAGAELVFPAVQEYSSGEIVRWIGPPDADEPAPRVTLEAAEAEEGGHSEGEATATTTTGEETTATATAESEKQPAPAAAEASDDESDDRATVALVLGIAGLVAGLAGLGVALLRRPRAA